MTLDDPLASGAKSENYRANRLPIEKRANSQSELGAFGSHKTRPSVAVFTSDRSFWSLALVSALVLAVPRLVTASDD